MPQSKFISAAGLRTHLLEKPASGVPRSTIVLVHGGGDGADASGNWESVMQRLPQDRVVAIDMVGFGDSAKPDEQSGYDYSQDSRDAHLAAAIAAIEPRGVVLVGNSMGGLTSLGVARRHPELVRSLVLMGSAGLPVPVSAALRTIMDYDYTRDGMQRIVAGLTAPGFRIDPALVDYRYTRSIEPATRYAYGRITQWNKARGGLHQPEENFTPIMARALVVAGKDDQVVPLSCAYRFLELLRNSSGYILPQCGHWPMIERPGEFASILSTFIDQGLAAEA